MPSWLRARRESKDTASEEALIRVCVVSRDAALVEEVHKDLMVGFSTRGGYDFEAEHPDFQHYCDVLFVDLRAAGMQGPPQVSLGSPTGADSARSAAEEGLSFIDAIRKSASHPPIVALCDADAGDFGRAVMRHGAYERLMAPLNMSQLRLALQRAYEFRLAETRLENFLSQEVAARENPRAAAKRKARQPVSASAATPSPAPLPSRQVRAPSKPRRRPAPSRLAIGFVLGCVIFFAGVVGVRTILSGMGDALASAGFAADPGGSTSGGTVADQTHSGTLESPQMRPFSAAADLAQTGVKTDSGRLSFRAPEPASGRLGGRGSVPGYEPAAIIERVTPRYSAEARAAHLQGAVRIRAVIGRDGVPHGLARVSGDPVLAQIAIDAIALWRYDPATIDGNPVESELIIPIDFRLPD